VWPTCRGLSSYRAKILAHLTLPDRIVTPATRRPGRRPLVVGAILAVAVVLVLLGGLLAWQPAVFLRAGLWLAGHEEVSFDQLRVGLRRLELRGLAVGGRSRPEQLVGRLTIDYRPGDLLRGRIEAVSVEGVTLRGHVGPDGLRLEGMDLAAAESGEAARLPALPLPERVAIRDVRLELATPAGVVTVPLEAQLNPQPDRATFVLDAPAAELAAPAGRLRADVHVEGEMPLDRRWAAGAITASGRAQLRAEALTVPGGARGVDGAGELAFSWRDGRLDGALSDLRGQVESLAPEWATVAELLPAPWRIELARPASISASLVNDGFQLQGRGRITLATAGPQLDATLSTMVALDPHGRVRELAVRDGEFDLRDLRVAGMGLDRVSIQVQGTGAPEAWDGALALELAGAGAPWPGVALEGATAQADLDVRLADGRLTVSPRAPATLQLASLSWAEVVRVNGLEVRVPPGAAPLLSAELADGRMRWQQHARASLPAFGIVATAGGTPVQLKAEAAELALELAGDGQELDRGRVVLSGGAVRVPEHQLRLSGIAADLRLSADGLDPAQPNPVSIASIVHEGAPPWFAPLRLTGSVQPEGDSVAFDLELARPAGDVRMRVRGQHDLARAAGRAKLDLAPVRFAPDRLQPAASAPVLAGAVDDVSGQLALRGALGWGAGGDLDADLDLLVEDLAFSSGPARFAQANGVIAFDRLAPLSTPPGQQLAIGLVDIGLPLTDGLLTFDLEPGQLVVEQLGWQLAQGRIRAAPFTIGSGPMRFATTLTAERLKLDEIFALAQLDGLSGEGTMHGTLPITIAGAEAVIAQGELVSDGPGWVRYRPKQPPAALEAGGQNVNLLLQALENFRYKDLRLTIDGRTDGEMDVRLHIAGANPDLYDGYPIEFNLNLEGALANVLRQGLAGYQIPERIRERMQGFGR
jgi:hypothetical protein